MPVREKLSDLTFVQSMGHNETSVPRFRWRSEDNDDDHRIVLTGQISSDDREVLHTILTDVPPGVRTVEFDLSGLTCLDLHALRAVMECYHQISDRARVSINVERNPSVVQNLEWLQDEGRLTPNTSANHRLAA